MVSDDAGVGVGVASGTLIHAMWSMGALACTRRMCCVCSSFKHNNHVSSPLCAFRASMGSKTEGEENHWKKAYDEKIAASWIKLKPRKHRVDQYVSAQLLRKSA